MSKTDHRLSSKISPKKSLGQHFLRSRGALEKIINAANVKKDDVILEVGPGEGVMTEELVKLAKKVIAIEKDQRAIEVLKEKFKKEIKAGKLLLIEKDILEADIKKIMSKSFLSKYKVVANIPYYISGALIRFFLESEDPPEEMTLLVQKEVAERIVGENANGKNKAESILSMSVKVYGKPSFRGVIKTGSFYPPPKVDSAIIKIENISKKYFKENNIPEKLFFEILHAGFAHKRKLVSKNLKEKGFKYPEELKERSRAEELGTEDWMKIVVFNLS
jgi:16S rRNA (adenine1518-N6/adenine1519-N6)-dimethyltransferase